MYVEGKKTLFLPISSSEARNVKDTAQNFNRMRFIAALPEKPGMIQFSNLVMLYCLMRQIPSVSSGISASCIPDPFPSKTLTYGSARASN